MVVRLVSEATGHMNRLHERQCSIDIMYQVLCCASLGRRVYVWAKRCRGMSTIDPPGPGMVKMCICKDGTGKTGLLHLARNPMLMASAYGRRARTAGLFLIK